MTFMPPLIRLIPARRGGVRRGDDGNEVDVPSDDQHPHYDDGTTERPHPDPVDPSFRGYDAGATADKPYPGSTASTPHAYFATTCTISKGGKPGDRT